MDLVEYTVIALASTPHVLNGPVLVWTNITHLVNYVTLHYQRDAFLLRPWGLLELSAQSSNNKCILKYRPCK